MFEIFPVEEYTVDSKYAWGVTWRAMQAKYGQYHNKSWKPNKKIRQDILKLLNNL